MTVHDPMRIDALSDLRHDLRSLVGQIIGYDEMLIEDANERGRIECLHDLEKIRSAGKKILDLIQARLNEDASPIFERSVASLPEPTLADASPASAFSKGAVARAASQESGERTAERGLILVVDDAEENRDILARHLERQGHEVLAVSGGWEALSSLAEKDFDLVLLDLVMPGMDGGETLDRIKGDPKLRSTPVIMISALHEIENVVRCIEMGAADYLSKPFNPTLLKARVGACLREKRFHDREARLYEELTENHRRLKELETLRDDLTGMIVHDLRAPLSSLLSGLQTIPLLGDLDEIQEELVNIAISGGEILLGMINDLLDVAKMEEGSQKLEYADLDAEALIEGAVGQIAMLAKEKNLRLKRAIPPDPLVFSGDEEKLRRTLVNLLGNAMKFTPEGGEIEIGAREEGDEILFFVRDSGEGIPKESFERIFEKFGQVESRKAGRKMSTGLGLTFCKMAVEAHQGRIWVESEPGQGSVFHFSIPKRGEVCVETDILPDEIAD